MLFHTKMCILGKYLYVGHTLFILYLEGNHTLFGEKLYFIWKFSSGNTEFMYLVSSDVRLLLSIMSANDMNKFDEFSIGV